MRITVESDPGYADRAMARRVVAEIRARYPEVQVVIVEPVVPRLPASYSAVASLDYGVRQMLRG